MCSDKTIHFVLDGTPGTDDCAGTPERHLGPRRRDLVGRDQPRLHRDRQRHVQREHGRLPLG
jgi:hypothetical protein